MCKVLNARQVGKGPVLDRVYVGRPSKWRIRDRTRQLARRGDREVPRMDRAAARPDGGAAPNCAARYATSGRPAV